MPTAPRRSGLLLLTLALLSTLGRAQAPTDDDPAAKLHDALRRGRWHVTAERCHEQLALQQLETSVGDAVDAALWPWLRAHEELRETVVWASAHEPPPKFFACLAQLRAHDQKSCERLPQLAVGFAFAWCAGDGDEPQRRWDSWTHGRAPIPTMRESFSWYVEHERELRTSLDELTWQQLAHTALNDVPLPERAWVLEQYGGHDLAALHDVFGQVPYIQDGLDGKAKTLANMREFGGVCTVNTQFQMGVMRTLGLPATFAGGPGHCWPCWLVGAGRDARFDRANDLGNADGTIGQWALPTLRFESDLRLLAAGLGKGAERLRAVELCSDALRRLAAADRAVEPTALLRLLRNDPFSQLGWTTLLRHVREQRCEPSTGARALRQLTQLLADHPRVQVHLLAEVTPRDPTRALPAPVVTAFEAACDALLRDADDSRTHQVRRRLCEFLHGAGQPQRAASLRLQLLRDPGAPDDGERTRAAGGAGGGAFEQRRDGHRLVGLRCTFGDYSGHRVLASVQPLFTRDGETVAGDVHGRATGERHELLAPDGHAVVGLEVRSGDLVDDVRLVTAPRDKRRVDLRNPAFSGWASGATGVWGALLGGDAEVVGIHGRCGDRIDALGLLTARR